MWWRKRWAGGRGKKAEAADLVPPDGRQNGAPA
jgi:hypothetical protein